MTEDEARAWLPGHLDVPRETFERLEAFTSLLRSEADAQNLIARSTLDHVWARHIVDSAQLLPLASSSSPWIDLGSGAGFPGLIVGALSDRPVTLVESRKKRVDFLNTAIDVLGIPHRVRVVGTRAETVPATPFGVISARAFAPLDKLLAIGARFAGPETLWVLPKGRNTAAELEAARRTWQGDFRIEPSVTDPDSAILIARQVRPREQR